MTKEEKSHTCGRTRTIGKRYRSNSRRTNFLHELNLLLQKLVENKYLVLKQKSKVICLEKFSILLFKFLPH